MKWGSTRAALFAAAVACLIVPASWADTIAGSTAGCFTTVNGNSTGCSATTATDAGLTFTQGSFSVLTDGNGFAAIGGGLNNLGEVALSSTAANYTGDTFVLDVTITDPSAGLGNVPAELFGDVTMSAGGGVTITFNNPTQIALANGDNLTLDVNPVSVFPSGTNGAPTAVTGFATVPEPSAILLLGSGLLSLGGIRRRWFR